MQFIFNKSIWIVLFFFLTLLTDCKTKQGSAESSPSNLQLVGASNQTKLLTLKLDSDNESESFKITYSNFQSSQSPLSFLKMSQFDEAESLGISIVDFRTDGSLYNLSKKTEGQASCFNVGIYSLLMASNESRLVLISSFTDAPTTGLSETTKVGDFRYCETENAITIEIANQEIGGSFAEYFNERGLDLVAEGLGVRGSLWDKFVNYVSGTKKEKVDITADDISKGEIKPTIEYEPVNIKAPKKVIAADSFKSVRSLSLEKRIAGNKDEAALYEKLGIADQLTDDNLLGKGAYASVYKITLADGKQYAVRKEPRGDQNAAEFESRVMRERANFLVQNEFALAYPDAGFIGTELSSLTKDGDFITISELKPGGELNDKITGKREVNGQSMETLTMQLQNQLTIYQKGIPIKFGGQKFQMSFFHGDIKPENAILDANHQQASFIDFGFSRIVLISEKNEYKELVIDPTTKKPTIKSLLVWQKNVNQCTPMFMSPEIALMRQSTTTKDGEAAFRVLKNIDIHAMNLTTFLAMQKKFPQFLADFKPGENGIKDLYPVVMKTTLRMDQDRKLRSPEMFATTNDWETVNEEFKSSFLYKTQHCPFF